MDKPDVRERRGLWSLTQYGTNFSNVSFHFFHPPPRLLRARQTDRRQTIPEPQHDVHPVSSSCARPCRSTPHHSEKAELTEHCIGSIE